MYLFWFLSVLVFSFFTTHTAFATSVPGDLRLSTFVSSTVATGDQNPLWVTSNRNGVYTDNQTLQGRIGFSLSWDQYWDNGFRISSSLQPSLLGSDEADIILEEAYITTGFRFLLLSAGIVPVTRGELPDIGTSSGSMSISTNARSLPRVSLHSDDFVSFSFLPDDIIQTNYGLSHGWFLDDRHVPGALLHEKWLYGRLQRKDAFSVHVGLVHHAKWGGQDDNGSALPLNWDNYLRIFTAREGGDDAAQFDQDYVAGDHLGIWDMGLSLSFASWTLDGYHHRFFEDSTGLNFRNATDGLWGLSGKIDHNKALPNRITFEIVNTRHQGGILHDLGQFGLREVSLGGRDSYYHHSAYRSGWTHHSRIIGTPLFIATGDGPETRISSNRIYAFHLGVSGEVPERLFSYRVLTTMVLHRPAYAEKSLIPPSPLGQRDKEERNYHVFAEASWANILGSAGTGLSFGIGYDIRNVGGSDSLGIILEVSQEIR